MLTLAHLGATHSSWDPLALLALAVAGWLFMRGPAGRSDSRRLWFVSGLLVVATAVASPLEALAAEMASAHMAQHILLLLVAGPILALSRPLDGLVGGLPRSWRKGLGRTRRVTGLTADRRRQLAPILAWMAYAGSLWVWHSAGLYQLALESELVHLVEHTCFLAASVMFWSVVLVRRRRLGSSPGLRGLIVFTTAFHSVLLAALLTFSDTAWYPSYVDTVAHWRLTPIDDQRLAGLLMWIPGGLVYTGVGVGVLLGWVRQTDQGLDRKPATQGSQRR